MSTIKAAAFDVFVMYPLAWHAMAQAWVRNRRSKKMPPKPTGHSTGPHLHFSVNSKSGATEGSSK